MATGPVPAGRRADALKPRRPFRKLRQPFISQPRHAVRCPDVHDRACRWIVVQRRDPKHHIRLLGTLRHDVSAAPRTEPPEPAGRGLERRELVRSGHQMKMIARDTRGRGKGRGIGLAAGNAVAMRDRRSELIDLITHGGAQTTSLQPQTGLPHIGPAAVTPPTAPLSFPGDGKA